MSNNALDHVLAKSTEYELWGAKFDDRLRQATIISGATIVLNLGALLMLPGFISFTYTEFFWVGSGFMRGLLLFMYQMQPWLIGLNLVCMIAYGVLLYFTNQLESGNAHWHDLATAEVVVGSICGLVLAIELTVIVLNVAIWIVVGILAIVALFVALAILGAAASG